MKKKEEGRHAVYMSHQSQLKVAVLEDPTITITQREAGFLTDYWISGKTLLFTTSIGEELLEAQSDLSPINEFQDIYVKKSCIGEWWKWQFKKNALGRSTLGKKGNQSGKLMPESNPPSPQFTKTNYKIG